MNTKLHIFLLTIILVFLSQAMYAQQMELRLQSLDTTDGLPSNTVRKIVQDEKGFMWFATTNGLSRYDGNSFMNFRTTMAEDEELWLLDNYINSLVNDFDGYLWIGTPQRRYNCYDLQRGRFVDYMHGESPEQQCSKCIVMPNGDVWMWDDDNGARCVQHGDNRSLKSWVFSKERGNLPDDKVRFVESDSLGRVWIASRSGLTVTTRSASNIVNTEENFFGMASDEQDTYFVTVSGDIYQASSDSSAQLRRITTLFPDDDNLRLTSTYVTDDKWILFTNHGVFDYDFNTQKVSGNDHLMKIKNGRKILDNRQECWIYNRTGYIYYYQTETGNVKEFNLIPKNKLEFIDYERYNIIHDSQDVIWISTYGNGLFAYDIATDHLEHFTAGMEKDNPLSSDYLLYIMEDRIGGIWVSMERSGVSRINIANRGISRILLNSPQNFDRSNSVRMIDRGSDGQYFLATNNGKLYRYDPTLTTCLQTYDFPANVYTMAQDGQGRYWIGTRGQGVNIGKAWYKHQNSDPTSLSDNDVFDIQRDQKGRMWIGTLGGGLNLAEEHSDGSISFKHFSWQNLP